jgi:ABC-type amino acid transport substrate-binding protein
MKGRVVAICFGLVLAGALFLQLLGASGGSPNNTPTTNTGASGYAGFARLLESERGIEVVTGNEPLAEVLSDEDEDDTVVVFNRFLDDDEREQLLERARFSRVIIVGTDTADQLPFAFETVFVEGTAFVDDPFVFGGATRLQVSGRGWDTLEPGTEPVAQLDDVVVIAAIPGAEGGVLYGVSTDSLFFNQNLAQEDNAAAVLNLMGDTQRVIVYSSSFADQATGFEAIPWRARWLLAGLSFASLLAAFSVGRRNGPAEQPHRDLPPPRSAYDESLGRMIDGSTESRFKKRSPKTQEPSS